MNKRKTFSEAFKHDAVRLLEQADKSPSDLAIDLGTRRNQLYKWQAQIRKHGEAAFQGPARKPADPDNELTRLCKELADLKEENEILKKAAVLSSRQRNTLIQFIRRCSEVQRLPWSLAGRCAIVTMASSSRIASRWRSSSADHRLA